MNDKPVEPAALGADHHAKAAGNVAEEAPKVLTEAEAGADATAKVKGSGLEEVATQKFKDAKQTGGLFSLFHGEEKQAAIVEKKLAKLHAAPATEDTANAIAALKKDGKAALGFFDKIRPGKTAAVAGAVAVTGMVLASMGNKGPSEQAAAVEAGRDDQKMARA